MLHSCSLRHNELMMRSVHTLSMQHHAEVQPGGCPLCHGRATKYAVHLVVAHGEDLVQGEASNAGAAESGVMCNTSKLHRLHKLRLRILWPKRKHGQVEDFAQRLC